MTMLFKCLHYCTFVIQVDVHCFLFTDLLLITKQNKRGGDKVKVIKPPMRLDKIIVQPLTDQCECFKQWASLCLLTRSHREVPEHLVFIASMLILFLLMSTEAPCKVLEPQTHVPPFIRATTKGFLMMLITFT